MRLQTALKLTLTAASLAIGSAQAEEEKVLTRTISAG